MSDTNTVYSYPHGYPCLPSTLGAPSRANWKRVGYLQMPWR